MDRRPRLLIVYFNSVYAVHCSRFFRRRGWNVHLAASSAEACQMIAVLDPTAVVVDGELPCDDASELCERITREYPGRTVVVATTDDVDADHRATPVVAVPRRHGVEGLAEHLSGVGCA